MDVPCLDQRPNISFADAVCSWTWKSTPDTVQEKHRHTARDNGSLSFDVTGVKVDISVDRSAITIRLHGFLWTRLGD